MTVLAATRVAAADLSVALKLGPYEARIGRSCDVMQDAFALRRRTFAPQALSDQDAFDHLSQHGIVTDARTGQSLLAFRVRVLTGDINLGSTYTGQSYDLTPLRALTGPFLELGRVCQDETLRDPLAWRLAWAALAALVDRHAVTLLIGCTSFKGADPDWHSAALGYLRSHHIGPRALLPRQISQSAIALPEAYGTRSDLPHLLQSYIGLGGWVSDHAVVDPTLDTVHVFTGLRIADISIARKRRLRELARRASLPT